MSRANKAVRSEKHKKTYVHQIRPQSIRKGQLGSAARRRLDKVYKERELEHG